MPTDIIKAFIDAISNEISPNGDRIMMWGTSRRLIGLWSHKIVAKGGEFGMEYTYNHGTMTSPKRRHTTFRVYDSCAVIMSSHLTEGQKMLTTSRNEVTFSFADPDSHVKMAKALIDGV